MTYQITVEDDKASIFLSFIRELSFVKVREIKDKASSKTILRDDVIPYFGADPDWEFPDRQKEHEERAGEW